VTESYVSNEIIGPAHCAQFTYFRLRLFSKLFCDDSSVCIVWP